MSDYALLKESINDGTVKKLAQGFSLVHKTFDSKGFSKAAKTELEAKELKQRVHHLVSSLHAYLPSDFIHSSKLLVELVGLWEEDESIRISGLAAWPVIDYVAVAGINEPEIALPVLEKLTPCFSAEFAVRPFYERYEAFTLETALRWTEHPNEHVRRLASEGLRPRLPWGKQLRSFISRPSQILPVLEKLNTDKSMYVRKSVANCLNDIAKDHPDFLIKVCKSWLIKAKSGDEESRAHLDWIIKHGARTLIKQGHPECFDLLGFSSSPKVLINNFIIEPNSISFGEELAFSFDLSSLRGKQRFVVDFCVYYQKANGRVSPKVFKLKNCEMGIGDTISLKKTLGLKPLSTRKYYSGEHAIAIHVNGKEQARKSFFLNP